MVRLRSVLGLLRGTDEGRDLLEQAHHWQERVFDRLTEGWSAERRHEFHRSMRDLMDRSRDQET
ncbi:hypothetical protein ACFW3Z_09030 [Nocardiopsis alba]|uniref:hypothetical protein n=1 Tax=Nocardiopsis alba TaxID=53437 RepID=UPI003672C95E